MGLFKKKSKNKYFEVKLKKLFKKYNYYLIGMDKYFNYSILEEITKPDVKIIVRDLMPEWSRSQLILPRP